MCSIGLIKVAEYIAVKLTSKIEMQSFKNSLFDWAAYFTSFKVYDLAFFLVSLILYALLYLYYLKLKKKDVLDLSFSHKLILVIASSAVINLLIIKFTPPNAKVVLLYFTLFFLGLVFFIKKQAIENNMLIKKQFFSERIYIFILFATLLHVFSYTLPLVMQPMLVENDYMDIPEKTIVSSKKIVDNTSYINQHFSQKIVKYDPRVDAGRDPELKEIANLNINQPQLLKYFFNNNFRRKYFYQYDEKTAQLKLFHRQPYSSEQDDLSIIFFQMKDKIKQFNLISHVNRKQLEKRQLSKEEKAFIKINTLELLNQSKAGWFLFHHSWVINPLHAVSLGDSYSNQVLIYGYVSSILLKKALDLMGGVNYQNYFKASYIIYPTYFISFLFGIWFLFGNVRSLAIAGLALGICYLGISYQLLVLAPGFNPLRHFWDIWGFVLLNEYLKNGKKLFIVAAIVLSLFSIVWSRDFGIALYFAIVAGFFVEQYIKERPYVITVITSLCLLGIMTYLLPIYGKSYNMKYMIFGVTLPQTPKLLIIKVLAVISLGYVVVINALKKQHEQSFLLVAVFIYFQIILIYFIWNPDIHHLISNTTGIILFGLILLELYHEDINQTMLLNVVNISFIAIYLFTSIFFYIGKEKISQIFKHHQIYQWNFTNAKFKSTMNPELFQESVKLIHKYDHENGIYLISKYDAILPLLSNTYNKIKAVSVALDMIGKKDMKRMAIPILQKKPKYIFVDTDICRNYINDIYNEYGDFGLFSQAESLGRATVMDNMKQLFFRVNAAYKLIEKGKLISVYEYKS